MLTMMEEATVPKSRSLETGAKVKPEASIPTCTQRIELPMYGFTRAGWLWPAAYYAQAALVESVMLRDGLSYCIGVVVPRLDPQLTSTHRLGRPHSHHHDACNNRAVAKRTDIHSDAEARICD